MCRPEEHNAQDDLDGAPLKRVLQQWLQQEELPESYIDSVGSYIVPLVRWIESKKGNQPLLLGINGAQGSGKSTMAGMLAVLLEHIVG